MLSGGEKSRVALAKTLIGESNFLLLDEPTNHLDMQSVNILIQALQQYKGTFIIVSHDRYFISEVANKIWYIEDKEIKEYPGTYEEYAYWQSQQAPSNGKQEEKQEQPKAKPKSSAPKPQNNNHEAQKELKRLKGELEKAENRVMELEEQKEQLEKELAKPSVFGNVDLLAENSQKFDAVEHELTQATESWEALAMKVEELEKQLN
ncbi:ATPase subunit of ABC transporter with duplicated ATPase domains [Catalinimonas alkaloidigena]|nr:ATPase subunit of ABC transporter with duplicated ATPase domains [Catalinimonas alkaloidigena]